MPTLREIELTLRQRSRDIDQQIALLRAEQKGLDWALELTLGHTAIQQDYLCDPLGRPVSMVEESPRKASGDRAKASKARE